jgi:hypothetical protein
MNGIGDVGCPIGTGGVDGTGVSPAANQQSICSQAVSLDCMLGRVHDEMRSCKDDQALFVYWSEMYSQLLKVKVQLAFLALASAAPSPSVQSFVAGVACMLASAERNSPEYQQCMERISAFQDSSTRELESEIRRRNETADIGLKSVKDKADREAAVAELAKQSADETLKKERAAAVLEEQKAREAAARADVAAEDARMRKALADIESDPEVLAANKRSALIAAQSKLAEAELVKLDNNRRAAEMKRTSSKGSCSVA